MYELPAPILFLDDIFCVIQVIKCSLLQYTGTIHLSNLDALYSTPGNCNIFYHSDNQSEYSTTNMESIFTARFSLNRLHLSTKLHKKYIKFHNNCTASSQNLQHSPVKHCITTANDPSCQPSSHKGKNRTRGSSRELSSTYYSCYSRILPTTYYSQNYSGIISPGLLHIERACCTLGRHLCMLGGLRMLLKWVSRAQIMECVIVVHSIAMS